MKCPKCGGRTVIDDYHTYLGLEVQRKCIVCGKLFSESPPPMATDAPVEDAPSVVKQSKSIGTCSVCHRPEQYLTRGMCPRHYQAWLKRRQPEDFVGPPAPPKESYWKKEVFQPQALAGHKAKEAPEFGYESEEEKALQTGAPIPTAIASNNNGKEGTTMAGKKVCIDCNREDMKVVARDRCGKCYSAAVKAGTITVTPRKPKTEAVAPVVPPPAATVPAKSEEPSTDEAKALAAQPVADLELFNFSDPRDRQLHWQLEESAKVNRRTVIAEILCRLEQSFPAAQDTAVPGGAENHAH